MNVMLKRIFRSTLPALAAAFVLLFMAACVGDDAVPGPEVPASSAEEAHEHGDDTHTHDAATSDTAGTYVDTTGAFFSDEPAVEEGHEHGADTHTHD